MKVKWAKFHAWSLIKRYGRRGAVNRIDGSFQMAWERSDEKGMSYWELVGKYV